jgi:hypothetical protein
MKIIHSLLGARLLVACRTSWLAIVFLLATSCGGTLSEEQRRKVRENMEANEIRKVTDAELTEASFAYGRAITEQLEAAEPALGNQRLSDSLQQIYHVRIVPLHPGDSLLLEIESQLIEAYTSGAGKVQLNDDVQKLGADSMLYTKPILREKPDGSVEFVQALGIHMPKKHIILAIKE